MPSRALAHLLVVLSFSWGAGPLRGQALPALDEHHVRVFGVAEGLPLSDIRDRAQTRDGHLYVASRGLPRFDGYGFEPVELPGFDSELISRLHADGAGGLWILSAAGDVGYLSVAASTASTPRSARRWASGRRTTVPCGRPALGG